MSAVILQLSPDVGFGQLKVFLNCYSTSSVGQVPTINFTNILDQSVASTIQANINSAKVNSTNYTDALKSVSLGGINGYDQFLLFLKWATGVDFSSAVLSGPAPYTRDYSSAATVISSGKPPAEDIVVDPALKNVYFEPVLKYGDAVVLRHKKYGFYLANCDYGEIAQAGGRGAYGESGVGSKKISDLSRLYLEPGNSGTRWGSGVVGTYVLSGDPVRFESMMTRGWGGAMGLNTGEGTFTGPMPPYYRVIFCIPSSWYISYTHRFYKKGGPFGSTIKPGDEVYIQAYSLYGQNAYSPQLLSPLYIGSTNYAVSSSASEIFYCKMPDANPVPPANFDDQFVWIVDSVTPNAYQKNPANDGVNASWPTTSGIWNPSVPASKYQF